MVIVNQNTEGKHTYEVESVLYHSVGPKVLQQGDLVSDSEVHIYEMEDESESALPTSSKGYNTYEDPSLSDVS